MEPSTSYQKDSQEIPQSISVKTVSPLIEPHLEMIADEYWRKVMSDSTGERLQTIVRELQSVFDDMISTAVQRTIKPTNWDFGAIPQRSYENLQTETPLYVSVGTFVPLVRMFLLDNLSLNQRKNLIIGKADVEANRVVAKLSGTFERVIKIIVANKMASVEAVSVEQLSATLKEVKDHSESSLEQPDKKCVRWALVQEDSFPKTETENLPKHELDLKYEMCRSSVKQLVERLISLIFTKATQICSPEDYVHIRNRLCVRIDQIWSDIITKGHNRQRAHLNNLETVLYADLCGVCKSQTFCLMCIDLKTNLLEKIVAISFYKQMSSEPVNLLTLFGSSENILGHNQQMSFEETQPCDASPEVIQNTDSKMTSPEVKNTLETFSDPNSQFDEKQKAMEESCRKSVDTLVQQLVLLIFRQVHSTKEDRQVLRKSLFDFIWAEVKLVNFKIPSQKFKKLDEKIYKDLQKLFSSPQLISALCLERKEFLPETIADFFKQHISAKSSAINRFFERVHKTMSSTCCRQADVL